MRDIKKFNVSFKDHNMSEMFTFDDVGRNLTVAGSDLDPDLTHTLQGPML